MQARWLDERLSAVAVILEDGERLGNQAGPSYFGVPPDGTNAEYAALLAGATVIAEAE
jgi:hypothetical protein